MLLLGDAMAGKSRAAYEALHRMPSGRWVLVPRDAGSLRRLGDGGIQLRDTVLWLDDLVRDLGVDGLDLALLERLIGEPGRRVALLAICGPVPTRNAVLGAPAASVFAPSGNYWTRPA